MKNKASEIWQTRASVPLQPRIPYPLRKIDSKHFTTRRSVACFKQINDSRNKTPWGQNLRREETRKKQTAKTKKYKERHKTGTRERSEGKKWRKRKPRRRWVYGYVGGSFGAFERQNQSDYTNVVERMFKRKVTQDRGKRLRGTCCWNTRFATESRIENGIEDRRRYYFPSLQPQLQ